MNYIILKLCIQVVKEIFVLVGAVDRPSFKGVTRNLVRRKSHKNDLLMMIRKTMAYMLTTNPST